MRIERVEPSKHKKGRILAFLEDGTCLKITEQELLDFGLRPGDTLDEETLVRLRASADGSNAKAAAAALVGRRAMSRADLTQKLREKGVSAAEADYAAQWLEAIGALNDADYAAALVRHCAQMGYGPARWRDELRRHGVDRELWDEAMDAAPPMEETIDRYLASRLRSRVLDERERKRTADALARRGFSWGEVKSALGRWTEMEAIDE
ncbi:MAG: regulatory protein RecX [Oscillibacter sp.]